MAIGAIVPYIAAAASVYSLGKGLSDGNFMQVAMGGLGMYSAMTNLTAAAGTAGATAETAALGELGSQQAQMLAEQTAGFGAEGVSMTADALGNAGGVLDDVGWAAQDAYQGLDTVGADATAAIQDTTSGMLATNPEVGLGGVLEGIGDTVSGGLESLQEYVGKFFNQQTGQVTTTPAPGSFQITAANIKELAPTLLKGAGMAMKYMGEKDQLKAQEDARKEAYRRQDEQRARIAYTPTAPSPWAKRTPVSQGGM